MKGKINENFSNYAAYNAEKYLVETLQSVVNQTLDDYEIITINDGSKDGTLDILKEYEKEYPNFTVISKENGGVSAARNDGLNVAQVSMFISMMLMIY